jgi:carbohydrate-selective porin OprB
VVDLADYRRQLGGYRHTLADRGLVFSGTNVTDQGNVSGGERKAFACADTSLFVADADLERLAGLDGLQAHAEFVSNVGQDLSTKSVANILQVATAFAQPGNYLGQLYVQQKLFNDVFTLQAGRMTTANNFASLPVFNDYISFADNPIPISLTNNTIYFTSLPSVEWATVGTVAVGVYNTNLPSGSLLPLEMGSISHSKEAAARWRSVNSRTTSIVDEMIPDCLALTTSEDSIPAPTIK